MLPVGAKPDCPQIHQITAIPPLPNKALRIGAVRRALQNQRDNLLAFAGMLDEKLDAIAHNTAVPPYLVRATCLLRRKPDTSDAFWQGWNRLHTAMGHRFY